MGMNSKYLSNELNKYMTDLASAHIWRKISTHWREGFDHITYQTSSLDCFDAVSKGLKTEASEITCIEPSGPFEVAIKLASPLVVNRQVRVDWVNLKEIDETSAGQIWEGVSALNALNVLVGSLETLKARLITETSLDFNENGEMIQIDINGSGRTLNFVETPLWEIVEERLEDKYAVQILPIRGSEPQQVRSREQ